MFNRCEHPSLKFVDMKVKRSGQMIRSEGWCLACRCMATNTSYLEDAVYNYILRLENNWQDKLVSQEEWDGIGK